MALAGAGARDDTAAAPAFTVTSLPVTEGNLPAGGVGTRRPVEYRWHTGQQHEVNKIGDRSGNGSRNGTASNTADSTVGASSWDGTSSATAIADVSSRFYRNTTAGGNTATVTPPSRVHSSRHRGWISF